MIDDVDDKVYDIAKKMCHDFGMPWTDPRTGITYPPPKEGKVITGGQYWERTPNGRFKTVVSDTDLRQVDAWICRRLADYPGARAPSGGVVGTCTECDAAIIYNPARAVTAPKVCFQCAGIQPLPFD